MKKQTIDTDPQALGSTIRKARREARLSQQVVADLLGLARTTLIAIEQGQRKLRVGELTRLAEVLDIEISHLLKESDKNQIREPRLSLSGTQARIIGQLTKMALDPILAKIVQNLYDTPQVMEAIASTLIHLLIQQEEEQSQSQWLQENTKGA